MGIYVRFEWYFLLYRKRYTFAECDHTCVSASLRFFFVMLLFTAGRATHIQQHLSQTTERLHLTEVCVCVLWVCNSGRCACNFYCNCIICKLNNKRPSNINHCSFMVRQSNDVCTNFQWTTTRIHANREKHELCGSECNYRLPYNRDDDAHTYTQKKRMNETVWQTQLRFYYSEILQWQFVTFVSLKRSLIDGKMRWACVWTAFRSSSRAAAAFLVISILWSTPKNDVFSNDFPMADGNFLCNVDRTNFNSIVCVCRLTVVLMMLFQPCFCGSRKHRMIVMAQFRIDCTIKTGW